MKKIILMISAIAFMANYSSAQENSSAPENNDFREQFQLGAKVGANLSNVYDAQGEEFKADSKFGFVFGGFLS
ncbi:MAG TPA: hypothetical protein VLR49_03575, partial [Ferruginibacter sp.]|nr:hypothetical protein [Ferruginibacter sp.]